MADLMYKCPFCGGEPNISHEPALVLEEGGYVQKDVTFVECTVCTARGHAFEEGLWGGDRSTTLAVKAWNLRK